MSFSCVLHLVMSSCALHHHVFKLASVRVSSFSPLSVLSSNPLARARGTSEILFYKWPGDVLGMGWKLACGVVLLLVDRLPSFIPFRVRLIAQPLNYSGNIVGQIVGHFRSTKTVAGLPNIHHLYKSAGKACNLTPIKDLVGDDGVTPRDRCARCLPVIRRRCHVIRLRVHLVIASCALHHHVFETCIRPDLLVPSVVRSEPRHTCTRPRHVRNIIS